MHFREGMSVRICALACSSMLTQCSQLQTPTQTLTLTKTKLSDCWTNRHFVKLHTSSKLTHFVIQNSEVWSTKMESQHIRTAGVPYKPSEINPDATFS